MIQFTSQIYLNIGYIVGVFYRFNLNYFFHFNEYILSLLDLFI